jgi:hypothetical protein
MSKIDFSDFAYYPSLRCSEGEHIGYRNLSDADKDALLPVFQVSEHGDKPSFASGLSLITKSIGQRPFILDFARERMELPTLPKVSKDPKAAKILFEAACLTHKNYTASYNALMDATDGYANWRSVVKKFPNAIPTILFDEISPKQILRQAVMLSRSSDRLAIRVSRKDDPKILPVIVQIASVLDTPDRLLIILDAGYSRQGPAKGVDFAYDAVSEITQEMSDHERSMLRIVYMSSSFPHLNHVDLNTIENKDWAAWEDAREFFPFLFGDHAAMHRHPLRAVRPRGWHAQIVFPREKDWIAYRDPNAQDKQGWCDGAEKIVGSDNFVGAPKVWGVDAIKKAAEGKLAGLEWPRDWYGAKVNIHLHRQIKFAPKALASYNPDEE